MNQKMFTEIVFYIHQNPVASGFVYEAEQWVYSMEFIQSNKRQIVQTRYAAARLANRGIN